MLFLGNFTYGSLLNAELKFHQITILMNYYDAEFYYPMTVWPKSIALSEQLSTFCN